MVTGIERRSSDGSPGTTSVPLTPPECRQALSAEVASGVNEALSQVLTEGTAAGVGPLSDWPSAGKTGTTDGPYDTWFVGYTAQRSTAVWVGDPGSADGRSVLRNVEAGGRYYGIVYGATIAAPIWKDLMTTAQQGLPSQPLP
jgi:membrane peptidoglycan carboxypeptidase